MLWVDSEVGAQSTGPRLGHASEPNGARKGGARAMVRRPAHSAAIRITGVV